VRAYEFLNYLNLRAVPAPGEGHEPITTVHVHALPLGPDGKPRFSALLLGHAPLVAREPLDLTLVVDNSGSMVGEGLARTLEGIRSLASRLRTGDTLSVVAYAEEAQVVLARTTIGDVEAFVEGTLDQEVLPALVPSGGSNLSAALELAYGELVGLGSPLGRTRRVMLFSDGGANVGVTSVDKIAAQAAAGDELGVFLTGVGVGPGPGYDDALMNELTDAGRGAYVYLDTLDEAERLGDRIDELTGVALRDVRFEIDVPEGVRIESSSAEQLGQVPELVRPQYVAPGDTLAVRFVLVQETRRVPLGDLRAPHVERRRRFRGRHVDAEARHGAHHRVVARGGRAPGGRARRGAEERRRARSARQGDHRAGRGHERRRSRQGRARRARRGGRGVRALTGSTLAQASARAS
jgi:Ca-activated chloride channel family protein